MPRIKAYKGNRAIIPVDNAKVATAYRCPFTNNVFGTKKQYVTHLKRLRKERMHKVSRQARYRRLLKEFNSQPSFEKIIDWVENHPEFFFDTAMLNDPFDRNEKYYAENRLNFQIKIVKLTVRWDQHVSNSHNAPFNGVKNWCGRDKELPTGYPGWRGHITIQMTPINTFSSRVFENTGLNTGGGGGGGSGLYGYEAIFFDSDWPELARRREKLDTLSSLGAPAYDRFKYDYGEVKYE